MHSSRMRTVRFWEWGWCLAGGGGRVSAWGVSGRHPTPRRQNDRHVLKNYLAATTLRTVKISSYAEQYFPFNLTSNINFITWKN